MSREVMYHSVYILSSKPRNIGKISAHSFVYWDLDVRLALTSFAGDGEWYLAVLAGKFLGEAGAKTLGICFA